MNQSAFSKWSQSRHTIEAPAPKKDESNPLHKNLLKKSSKPNQNGAGSDNVKIQRLYGYFLVEPDEPTRSQMTWSDHFK